ncbi:MAG: LPS export ABC transporter periplasmic protein LptC [Rickettsiales bacterium]
MSALSSPSLMDGARYARRVRRMKLWLATFACSGVLALSFYVFFTSGAKNGMLVAPSEPPRLTAPHFRGVDDLGHPFDLRAKAALWKDGEEVELDAPQAEAAYGDKGSLRLRADKGLYETKSKRLFLDGEVKAFAQSNAQGLPEFIEIHARGVAADLPSMFAQSNEPVEIISDAFTLEAAAFTADGKKNVAAFTEGVRLILRPKAFKQRHINMNMPER